MLYKLHGATDKYLEIQFNTSKYRQSFERLMLLILKPLKNRNRIKTELAWPRAKSLHCANRLRATS